MDFHKDRNITRLGARTSSIYSYKRAWMGAKSPNFENNCPPNSFDNVEKLDRTCATDVCFQMNILYKCFDKLIKQILSQQPYHNSSFRQLVFRKF